MLAFFVFFFLIFGLIIGSFLNCLVWRLYKEETLGGRSYCPQCHHQIDWYDNLPVLSFIILHGKCRHCHKKISWQYPLVELIVSLLFGLSFFHFFGFNIPSEAALLLASGKLSTWIFWLKDVLVISIMTIVFVFDLRWMLISNLAVVPATIIILAISLLMSYLSGAGVMLHLGGVVIAIIASIAFFGSQYVLTSGRGLGEGDIWLGVLMAVIFIDWRFLAVAVLLSYVIGAAISLGLLAFKQKQWTSQLPLGVFLALGTIITLFFGNNILSWYLGWF